MCRNPNCKASDEIAVRGVEAFGFEYQYWNHARQSLDVYELDHFELIHGHHPPISDETLSQLKEVLFPLRHLCWECSRDEIAKGMSWNFSLFDWGVPFDAHEEALSVVRNFKKIDFKVIDNAWTDLLAWSIFSGLLVASREDEDPLDEDELLALIESKISPEALKSIIDWHVKNAYYSDLTLSFLIEIIESGYEGYWDLNRLACDDLPWLLSDEVLPMKEFLVERVDGLEKFMLSRKILENLQCDFVPKRADIMRLLSTGVELGKLSEVSIELGELLYDATEDNKFAAEFVNELNDGFQNWRGESLYTMYSNTAKGLAEARLAVSAENFIRYWGLSSDLILYVVDNDLLSDDVLKIARLVENPVELASWLETGFELISHDLVRDWVKTGFSANEAHEWCRSRFDAETASRWRQVTDNPVAARRRIEAGIQPPEGAI